MILFPAIDLKDGRCVRLRQGDASTATVFNERPAAQAMSFAAAGCRWLHVVDLDGAFGGGSVNGAAVEAILAAVSVPVQLGGGIRDLAAVERWLEKGVARVVLGTAAVRNPGLVLAACRACPGRIVVGIDARQGRVATEGWARQGDFPAVDVARRFEDCGVAAIVYTDIARDGMLTGPNIDETLDLAEAVDVPVIASGGISSIDDLRAVVVAGRSVLAGVVCGRALYDGRIDLAEALKVFDDGERAA
jgi:phosphoribosylformimino-5-aminoimidazole carboxamide ribotide isomerase